MKNKELLQSKSLKAGDVLETEFCTYQEMAEHSPDWSLFCNYQLEPHGMDGKYKILELPSMQLAHSSLVGGFMFSFEAPKDKVCFSIIASVEAQACFENIKLSEGMIVVFDDRRVYNFMSRSGIELIDVSMDKDIDSPLVDMLIDTQQNYFVDTGNKMETLLRNTLSTHDQRVDKESVQEIEMQIIDAMSTLIQEQTPKSPKLTKGENITLDIRDQLFKHMDAKLNTSMLAEQYHVTTQTLQNSFKSLFGYTPQIFLRLLKLNLVHHELYESNERDTTVLRVAQKWGFNHMGRLSGFYKVLFGETPSSTLKEEDHEDDGMRLGCVERQEDITI